MEKEKINGYTGLYKSERERFMTQEKINEVTPLPCPFCGCSPKISLAKKYYCQLHGEPRQAIAIFCDWKDCKAKPRMEVGNIYNGIGDIKYKKEATEEAIKAWNTRAKFTRPTDSTENTPTKPINNEKIDSKKSEADNALEAWQGVHKFEEELKNNPPDYETPLTRAKLINEIHSWYEKKFKGKSGYEKVSVFDLIADFIIDTKFTRPADSKKSEEGQLVPLDRDKVCDELWRYWQEEWEGPGLGGIERDNFYGYADLICSKFGHPPQGLAYGR